MLKKLLSALVALMLFISSAGAAPLGPLDLIPADAAAGIMIRNLDDLKEKGDKLLTDSDAKVTLRFSQAYDFILMALGVNKGLDTKQSGGLVVASKEFGGQGGGFLGDLDRRIVVILPFTSLDDMAGNFGIEKMKPETMTDGKGANFGKYFYARGSHLYLGDNDKAVAAVAKGKPAADQFAGERKKSLAEADVLLLVNFEASKSDWKEGLKELENSIPTDNSAEADVLKKLVQALTAFRFGAATLKIDDGLGVRFLLSHPKEEGKKFLAELGTAADPSGLAGLPEGNVIAAQALRGDGARNALLVKALLQFFMRDIVDTQQIISAADRVNYINVFTDVWQRLKGTRVAVYQTGNEAKLGLFSAVAILDADDPDKFLDNLRLLAKFADGSILKRPEDKEDPIQLIEKLVRDLGDNDFFTRHAASTKLALLGDPALPFLEKALKSTDPEVRFRAEELVRVMRQSAAERRKELLAKDAPRPARPTFTVVPKAEVRGGQPVHIVLVKLQEQDAGLAGQLRQLFGPDWDRIRLATQGKHVVALLGSDVSLLDATVANLKDSKPGLAGVKSLAGFQKYGDPKRQFEFHVSAQRAITMVDADPAPGKQPAVTSVSLAVDTEHVQLDLWMPPAELGVVLKNRW